MEQRVGQLGTHQHRHGVLARPPPFRLYPTRHGLQGEHLEIVGRSIADVAVHHMCRVGVGAVALIHLLIAVGHRAVVRAYSFYTWIGLDLVI